METLSAEVIEEDAKHFIVIDLGSDKVRIPLTDDKPAQVKKAFNRLIRRIKEGPFVVKLIDVGEDLFSQVAEEYIKQLNKEVREVRAEMVQHALVHE
jgi:Txe/YoeB family toxin of Txe-Axe toxin-antitoxin module